MTTRYHRRRGLWRPEAPAIITRGPILPRRTFLQGGVASLFVNQLGGFGARQKLDMQFTDDARDEDVLTTYTFSSASLGAVSSKRGIIIPWLSIDGDTGNTFSSATIGGVSATNHESFVDEILGPDDFALGGILTAVVPTGATGDVVIVLSTSSIACAITVYRIVGYSSLTPVQSDQNTAADTGVITLALSPREGDAVVAAAVSDGNNAHTWSGLTERVDANWDTAERHCAADELSSTGGANPTCTSDSGTPDIVGVGAVFR